MSKLKLGYVGCGFMAQKVHLPNIKTLDNVELAALAEIRPKLGKAVQERLGVPRLYSSHTELAADPDIDAVAISGPAALQGEVAIDVLKAGKDVFMEKPLAISTEQANRILVAEKESGHRLMIAYMKRYDSGNIAAKEEIDKFRKDGKPTYARNHGFGGSWLAGIDTVQITTDEPSAPPDESKYLWPEWLPNDWRERYIGYLQQYVHNINLIRWFVGEDAEISVQSAHMGAHGNVGLVVLDIGGCLCTIESGGMASHTWNEHTQVYFQNGYVRVEAPPLLLRNVPSQLELYRKDKGDTPGIRQEIFPLNGRLWSYKAQIKHFIQCVQDKTPFRTPAADAAKDVATVEGIYRRVLGI
jgi:predicted dehydrogenase